LGVSPRACVLQVTGAALAGEAGEPGEPGSERSLSSGKTGFRSSVPRGVTALTSERPNRDSGGLD